MLSGALSAQETPKNTEKDDKKIVVTGTRIKKIDINNLSPILSISREDIDKQGYATVKDVIDGLTQNTGGTFDNSATFGFSPGASSVNLRGIGFGHTLVLVDGRRLPIYPIGIGGTSNFVDLSSIPMAFVERIDVLTDGASAVYGSDAVSGVINIITRKDIEGIAMNYRFGDTSDEGYENHRFNLLTGARNGDTQIDLILDFWRQKALWASQRDYAASDVSNPRGEYSGGGATFYGLDSGQTYQHPDCGTPNDPLGGLGVPNVEFSFFEQGEIWCGFDRSAFRQLIAPQDRSSLMSRLTYEVSPELSFFGRIGFSNTQTDVQLEPNFYGGAVFNGFGSAVANNGAILPPGAINNPTTGTAFEESGVFVRRLIEFGPRQIDIDNNAYNLLGGLQGSFGGGQYDWEFGVSYNKTDLDIDSNNILLSALNSAVDNGLDLFQPIPQSTVNALTFTANRNSYSSNRAIDFSISGDLDIGFEAGPIQFAVAAEKIKEEYSDQPDPLVAQGDAFDGSSSGRGERKHLGVGGELSFPFSDNFELDIALRWDDYDDASSVDSAFSPRVAMGYRPTDTILTRFSWGKSFRAPDMQRLFGGATRAFVDIVDPEFQIDSNGVFCPDPDADPTCNPALVQSVRVTTLSNIDLNEEEGSNVNLGIVWEPNEDLSVSLDYFQIKLDEVVAAPSAQWIVAVCSEFDVLCEFVNRDAMGTLSGGGASITTQAINFAEQDTDGVDLSFNYDWSNQAGKWSASLNTTWVSNFKTRFTRDSAKVERVGLGELPEYRINLMFDWRYQNWGATFRVNYIDELVGQFCAACDDDDYIDSWTTFSLNTRYSYSEYTRIRFGINNLTNEEPPQDPTQVNWPWFFNGGGYYNPIGREFYLQLDTSL
ncbi:TonB-dependent receptor [Aliikangiella coralliicola]|nr:TonB-dependent receptor [Aliikangiella coralliicola]